MKEEIKNSIIERLGDNFKNNEKIIKDLLDDYWIIATENSNRKKYDRKLVPHVKTAVIEAYIRMGDEGSSSSSEGSQSSSYIDIEEKLKKDVRSIRVIK